MVDVLYSLVDANERFNHLILDSLYIHNLNMVNMTIKSYYDRIFSIDKHVLDRICKKILPRMYHQVNELIVEQYSMKRILHTVNYPQLYSLSLINFQAKRLLKYLTDDSILREVLTEQITNLKIDIQDAQSTKGRIIGSDIFVLILSLCKRLTNLNFCHMYHYRRLPFCIFNYVRSTHCMSSTLTNLKICVINFGDCLYLLDGRLDCLSTLIIHVNRIYCPSSIIQKTEKLPKLKCFSLSSVEYTRRYDDEIIPLLRRMINLEELTLLLPVLRFDSTYIDGIHLHDQILIYMPQLNKFTFSINTLVVNMNAKIDLPSHEDIQRSFIEKKYGQVGSYVDNVSTKIEGSCHVYSLPFQFEYFLHLNNCFQGGMFDKVLYLFMTGVDSFEHELFKIVSQDFPLLRHLYIENDQPQKNKQHSSTLNIFPHLLLLDLFLAHLDYAEQFLNDKNTYMPHLLNLNIKYKSLVMITNNFNNDAQRLNCTNLKKLTLDQAFVRPENFCQYFPLL
ncbi:unnamed protein product [Rotaria sp. Silwood2]|nr:unnamed protein product [Rotaria sp. Silwood2]